MFEKYSACGDTTMGGDLRFKRPRLWDCPNPNKNQHLLFECECLYDKTRLTIDDY